MADFNPLAATGLLWRRASADQYVFAGSCFGFRHPDWWLTAAHCVVEANVSDIRLIVPDCDEPQVDAIETHPEADVSLIRVDWGAKRRPEPFWGCVGNYGMGEDFFAFGYPESVFGPDSRMPTARLFKGHFQRFLDYRSFAGYRYGAGEMSVGAPAGLSGGPLFRPGAPPMLTGLVAENLESTTAADFEEESPREKPQVVYRRVITYGIAVMLEPIKPWLDERVPAIDHEMLGALRGA
jgi:hypothetical protein